MGNLMTHGSRFTLITRSTTATKGLDSWVVRVRGCGGLRVYGLRPLVVQGFRGLQERVINS